MDNQEYFRPFPLAPCVMVGHLGTIIKPNGKRVYGSNHNLGYMQLGISIGNQVKVFKVHRVVAITWLDNPLNKETINHINGNKKDNRVANLEWATRSENVIHAFQTGLHYNTINAIRNAKRKPVSAESRAKMSAAKLGLKRAGYKGKWIKNE